MSGKTDFKKYLTLTLNLKVINIFRDVCCNQLCYANIVANMNTLGQNKWRYLYSSNFTVFRYVWP